MSTAVSITETLFEFLFATYARVPAWLTSTPTGSAPTVIVATTEFVVVINHGDVAREYVRDVNPWSGRVNRDKARTSAYWHGGNDALGSDVHD